MKKIRKIAASVLSVSMVVGIASCGGGGGGRAEVTADPSSTDAAVTTAMSTTTWQTNETDANLQDAVANLELDTDIKVEKKLKWMAWWPMDETSGMCEAFKANYGIPEEGDESYGEYADKIFVYQNVAYDGNEFAQYDTLGKAIATDQSPDLFPFEIRYFPIGAIKNLFQPIDDVVDTYSDDYKATRSAMDQFMWGGKNYCVIAPNQIGLMTPLWYRRSVVEENGLDDPLTLYNEGKWDWDAFRDMMRTFQNTGADKAGVDGWYISQAFLATTGVPVIGITDGKLVNHLNDPAIERAMAFLEELPRSGLVTEAIKTGSVSQKKWLNGDILFYTDGDWFFQEFCHTVVKAGRAEAEDFMAVPWPKDPSADKYYQELKNSCNMWVAGSKNKAGFQAYCACEVAVSNDAAVTAASREKLKRDYDFTDELMELLYDRYPFDVEGVFDCKNGVGPTTMYSNSPVSQVTSWPAVNEQYSFTDLRAESISAIDAGIEEANATLG